MDLWGLGGMCSKGHERKRARASHLQLSCVLGISTRLPHQDAGEDVKFAEQATEDQYLGNVVRNVRVVADKQGDAQQPRIHYGAKHQHACDRSHRSSALSRLAHESLSCCNAVELVAGTMACVLRS